MGDWLFSYDAMDRLTTAAAGGSAPSAFRGQSAGWSYDSYGNRTGQNFSNSVYSNWANYNPANNRITTATSAVAGYVYDASGNTLFDGYNEYWYDAEGQLCAAAPINAYGYTIAPYTSYIYDAEGARIGKGTLSAPPAQYTLISANLASSPTCAPPFSSGFTLTTRYLVDLSGNQVTEMSEQSGQVWKHSNVFSAARLTATYDASGLHYALADPLGTKRVQANISGQIEESCISLPFGDALNCTPTALPTADDATEHHFTGKERDTESGNDYFEARYYSSSMGRFMSPDWSAKEEPVPYAKLDDPQTLNLYSYVGNNLLTRADADGHNPLLLALAGGGVLADEAPLAAIGPVGWTVIGVTAVGVLGVAAYEHYHQDAPAPTAKPAPTTSTAGQSTPASPQEPNRKEGGSKTEPKLPKKTVANEDGVEIKHFTRSGDHGPAHLHVEGGGESTKIGMNGKPLSGSPELSPTQQSVVDNNLSGIRSAVNKIQRWFNFNSK